MTDKFINDVRDRIQEMDVKVRVQTVHEIVAQILLMMVENNLTYLEEQMVVSTLHDMLYLKLIDKRNDSS